MKHSNILSLLILLLCNLSCSNDTTNNPGNTIKKFNIITPDMEIVLSSTNPEPIILSWERTSSTNNASIFYKILFSSKEKDFSNPLCAIESDKNGYDTSIALQLTEIDNIAGQAGIEPGETGDIYWTVEAESGLDKYINPDARTITVTRINAENSNPEVKYWSEAADSLNEVLVEEFLNKNTGTFWGSAHNALDNSDVLYWQQAHYINVLIYAYERIHQSADSQYRELAQEYKRYFQLWFENHANNWHNPDGFYNGYTDDMCWMVLTLIHMTEATGDKSYYQEAKRLYDEDIITRADDDGKGWALPWTDKDSKRIACTNNPACIGACLLYEKTQDPKYLDDAKKLYDYIVKNIMTEDGKLEKVPLSYTQGTFIEAARRLYHLTGETRYMEKAEYVMKQTLEAGWCTKNGLLRNEGTSSDQSVFKAIFVPYAVNFVLDSAVGRSIRTTAKEFLLYNAETLWKSNLDRNKWPKMYCSFWWGETWSDANEEQYKGSTGAHTSGCSLIENVARMVKEYNLIN